MSVSSYADDLGSAVHYALETTHAIAVCPFHLDLTIRIGDDAAESHAFARARKLVKSDGTTWEGGPSGKSLDANSAGPLTGTVLTAPFWGTRNYSRAVSAFATAIALVRER